MYIKTLKLENFQSHENSVFEFSPHLSTIVGVSNVGKSSVSRALSCVLFGNFDKSWVRSGCKFARIIIETDTGIIVERQKGDKVNKYILTLPGAQPQTFENFGVGVPEAVQKALRIHEVQIDSKDSINLNLSSQLENLFLLSQSNSYKAKVFGKLSGAHILDSAIREINREGRSYSTEKVIKEKELVELQGQVDKLAQIEQFALLVQEIEARLASLSVQEGRLNAIRSLFERVNGWKASWQQETAKEAVLTKVEVGNIESLLQKVSKIDTFRKLCSRISEFNLTFDKQTKLQELLTSISLDVIPVMVQKVGHNKILLDLASRIAKNQNELVSKTDELGQVEQKYQETSKQYSDMLKVAGVCPICNRSTIGVNI
jgi:DNA repair ATPase RecN